MRLPYYHRAVPLSRVRHGNLCVQPGGYAFARFVNSIPLTAAEMPIAAREYPVVFTRSGDGFLPVVILGVEQDENLFVDEQGHWQAHHVPAFVRQYPFVYSQSQDGTRFVPYVDESWEGCNWEGRGERLFDRSGEKTPFLSNKLAFLEEYRFQAQQSQGYCEELKKLGLLEPSQAEVKLSNKVHKSLAGFYVVNRDKLKTLPADTLVKLASTNELEITYAHLWSLRNFEVLARRVRARRSQPTTVAASNEDQHQQHVTKVQREISSLSVTALGPEKLTDVKRSKPSVRPDGSDVPTLDQQATRLFELLRGLGVRYLQEPSVRIRDKELLANRFLLTVCKGELTSDALESVLAICREMQMTEACQSEVRQNFGAAQFIHFGFESDNESSLYKVYLEFARQGVCPPAAIDDTVERRLLHLAFKWDVAQPSRNVVTKYHLYPPQTVAEMTARMRDVYGREPGDEPLAIAVDLLEMAACRMDPREIQYLEATEKDGCRRSFDLNFYDAELQVRDLRSALSRMRSHYQVDAQKFESVFDPIGSRAFGHLAGGVHRNGRDFFNLYYGAEGRAR